MSKQTDFIKQIAPIIQKYAKQYGYHVASPIIAQACIESGWGASSLAAKYHNYFGLKCGSGWSGKSVNLSTKEEYTPGTLTAIKDNFRVFNSMEEGVKGYFEFIKYPRYANLKTAMTAQQYLERIKADGYATSSTYVNTNMKVVTQYGLTVYDDFSGAAIENTSDDENGIYEPYMSGKVYVLDADMYVRESPGMDAPHIPYEDFTKDGKKRGRADKDGNGILKKGTKVTCKAVEKITDGSTWIQIPSGWVCAVAPKGTVYVY